MPAKIPQYAAAVPRARLIKIACRRCKVSRFAEVSAAPWQHRPGHGAADAGGKPVSARCLYCGGHDTQSSMWLRL